MASKPLDEFMPANPVMAAMWVGSLTFALSNADFLAAFRHDTGMNWTPGRTPIDRMIDEASGAGLAFLKAFAKWHNQNIWGEQDGRPVDAGTKGDTSAD